MIKFFNSVMRLSAVIAIRAIIMGRAILYIGTYLTSVGTKLSPSIFLSFMVKETFFRIMLILKFALLSLKIVEINEYDYVILLLLVT